MSAMVTAIFPLNSLPLLDISNNLTIWSCRFCLFCSKNKFIPPIKLSAIVTPILAILPTVFPNADTTVFTQL